MSDAELTIRLVDGSPEEQAAFDQPTSIDPPALSSGQPAPGLNGASSEQTLLEDIVSPSIDSLRDAIQQLFTTEHTNEAIDINPTLQSVRDAVEKLINNERHDDFQSTDQLEILRSIRDLVDQIAGESASKASSRSTGGKKEQAESGGESSASANKTRPFDRAVNTAMRFLSRSRRGRVLADGLRRAASVVRNSKSWAEKAAKIGQTVAKAAKAMSGRGTAAAIGEVATATAGRAVGGAAAAGAAGGGAAAGAGGAAAAGGAVAAGAALATPLAPVAIVAISVTAAFVALAAAAKMLTDIFQEESERLREFSAEISLARDIQQANTEMNLLDRARKIGPELGQLDSARAKLNNQLEKLWTQILEILVKLEPAITTGVNSFATFIATLRAIEKAIEIRLQEIEILLKDIIPGDQGEAQDRKELQQSENELKAIRKEIKDIWERQNPELFIHGMDPQLQRILAIELDAFGNVKPGTLPKAVP